MGQSTRQQTAALWLAMLMMLTSFGVVSAQPAPASIFLRGTGAAANPATLFLDTAPPVGTTPKFKSAGVLAFTGGNPWRPIGTWEAASPVAADTFLTALGPLHIWLGLVNSDDQGTRFDLKVEVFNDATLVGEGILRCIAGITRNPSFAKEVVVSPLLTRGPQSFDSPGMPLRVTLSARIGTAADETRCAGHASAVGLRAYFDAANRDARLNVVLTPRGEVVGEITADILRASRDSESPLGDVVADAQLAATAPEGAQIALVSPVALRTDLRFASSHAGEADGEITLAEAVAVLPFGNRLVTMSLTGAQLDAVLEQQRLPPANTPLLLQVSEGFTYSLSRSNPEGSRVSNLVLDGTPVDPAATYRVTVNDFLAEGGENFTVFQQGTQRVTSTMTELGALLDYFAAFSPVSPGPANRIQEIP